MALIGYSDSEDSGNEQEKTQKFITKVNTSAKPAFQKVIDRSNPHVIKVTLPAHPTRGPTEDDIDHGPPKKRARVGGGTFSDFNSLLPAPKRSAFMGKVRNDGAAKGLGSGVSLKTGAAPRFSREPMPITGAGDEGASEGLNGGDNEATVKGLTDITEVLKPVELIENNKPDIEPKKQGNSVMFKPLSVARRPQKKKKASAVVVQTISPGPSQKPTPKVSLFSMNSAEKDDILPTGKIGEYRPLVYQALDPDGQQDLTSGFHDEDNNFMEPQDSKPSITLSSNAAAPISQSLDSIAADLNLSASAKRQLFGRQRNSQNGNAATINVVNFITDQEYAANELLRQAGEQATHNPVRAIASGKHNLKQLVNAASNQKEALEEHFASGRRNKKEAGSKYGW